MLTKLKNPHKRVKNRPPFNMENPAAAKEIILEHLEEMKLEPQVSDEEDENTGLLILKSANSWIELAASQRKPEMLFDEFWFEGELCILFADANLGKSILAVQIGNSISKGEPIGGFRLEAEKQMILYFDFELSAKQFQNRYSIDYQQPYMFDDNFIRIELNPDARPPEEKTFEEYLSHELEKSLIETNAKVLIIDNLTYLRTETEKAAVALPLMKELKTLKNKYVLSILALAHTPKRDLNKGHYAERFTGQQIIDEFYRFIVCDW